MEKNNNSRTIVIICVLLTAFCFSTMEVALKLGGGGLDSLQLTFLRFLIGGLILLPFGIKENAEKPEPGDLAWVSLVGIMGIPISMLCFQLGVERCNAATAATIMSLNPLITMLFAHFFLGDKLTRNKKIAFCLGVLAGIFLMRPWDVQEGNTPLGMILMVAAASTFSLYGIMGKRTIARVGTFRQISLSFLIGSFVLLIIMLFMGRPVVANVAENLPLVLYVGIFVTGVGYLCLNTAIKISDATTGSIAFFIKPVMAPIFAVLILQESILWNTVVGIIFLIGASALTLFAQDNSKDV